MYLQSYKEKYPLDILNPNRRTYLGMVTAMDDAIGNLTDVLKANEMFDNTIIIFISDNGGIANLGGGASNYPLKRGKGSFYEGGVRTPAFVHAPNLVVEKAGLVSF